MYPASKYEPGGGSGEGRKDWTLQREGSFLKNNYGAPAAPFLGTGPACSAARVTLHPSHSPCSWLLSKHMHQQHSLSVPKLSRCSPCLNPRLGLLLREVKEADKGHITPR